MKIQIILSLIILAFCFLIFRKGFIDFFGACFSAALLIAVTFLGKGRYADSVSTLLVYIVIFSMSLIKKNKRKEIYFKIQGELIQRTYKNVIGKLLLPVTVAIFFRPAELVALLGYSVADSAGSQIGVFSRTSPRLLTTLKKRASGTNGAISFLGTSLGIALGIIVGFVHAILSNYGIMSGPIWACYGALVGSTIDSFLGATIESSIGFSDWSINLLSGLIVFLSSSVLF